MSILNQSPPILTTAFFDQDAKVVAQQLIGKVIQVKRKTQWLSAMIIETEAYYINDKASHASLGYTEKRKALFMPAGTIYMYYARGGDSLNVSCHGAGNAVLIKSAYPYQTENNPKMIQEMQLLNPPANSIGQRPIHRLCAGQVLLCRSLGLKVPDWDQQQFDAKRFFIENVGYQPQQIIKTTRLGIPAHRDPDRLLRFIDQDYVTYCTAKPTATKTL